MGSKERQEGGGLSEKIPWRGLALFVTIGAIVFWLAGGLHAASAKS